MFILHGDSQDRSLSIVQYGYRIASVRGLAHVQVVTGPHFACSLLMASFNQVVGANTRTQCRLHDDPRFFFQSSEQLVQYNTSYRATTSTSHRTYTFSSAGFGLLQRKQLNRQEVGWERRSCYDRLDLNL